MMPSLLSLVASEVVSWWKPRVIIIPMLSLLSALIVVIRIPSSPSGNGQVVVMMILSFHWYTPQIMQCTLCCCGKIGNNFTNPLGLVSWYRAHQMIILISTMFIRCQNIWVYSWLVIFTVYSFVRSSIRKNTFLKFHFYNHLFQVFSLLARTQGMCLRVDLWAGDSFYSAEFGGILIKEEAQQYKISIPDFLRGTAGSGDLRAVMHDQPFVVLQTPYTGNHDSLWISCAIFHTVYKWVWSQNMVLASLVIWRPKFICVLCFVNP